MARSSELIAAAICTEAVGVVRQAVRGVVPERVRTLLYHRLESSAVVERLLGETPLIEDALRTSGEWGGYRDPTRSRGKTERVVEIPWALSRYKQEQCVLDVGTAYALRVWVRGLVSLGIPDLHGVDLSPRQVPGITMTRADVRRMPFADESFDLIYCISTLEHIGLDNTNYQIPAGRRGDQDVVALKEMARVLRPGGRILVSVPFGLQYFMGWQKQYDLAEWERVRNEAGLSPGETAIFRHAPERGWIPVPLDSPLPASRYRANGAPAASAVLCTSSFKT